jgi:hypothetical protein
MLNREINTCDYPLSRNLYGVLKLAAENIGFAFNHISDLSIINLRIGSVRKNEDLDLKDNDRFKRTILHKEDLVNLIECAITTTVKYGTYYAVSENSNKPWSIENTIQELIYSPKT